jgi:DNA-binding CsgD family transcriptional regulator
VLLQQPYVTAARPSTGWNSLTPTELEVVQLVVDGLNNGEVGARLFMSRGTVKTHLSHGYTKLGMRNRTELTTVTAARSSRNGAQDQGQQRGSDG